MTKTNRLMTVTAVFEIDLAAFVAEYPGEFTEHTAGSHALSDLGTTLADLCERPQWAGIASLKVTTSD